MSRNETEHLLGRHGDGQENVQKPNNLIRPTRIGFSSLLFTILCSILLSPCLAIDLNRASASLHTFNSKAPANWENCGEVNNHTLECTRIDVPVDHFSNSSDGTFSIPLIRMLATNASATGGKSILLNPGGPGASGTVFLQRAGNGFKKMIGEGFHLLSFDPRGVNGSIPQASCYTSDAQRAEKLQSNPWDITFEAGVMFTNAENGAKACSDTSGEHGLHINTPQTAADMNSILDAIGQEDMYYWGGSYGTILGQTYAQMFPERVSRLVIDAVSNLDEWYNSFYPGETFTDTDKVFDGFIDECFAAKENCPLNAINGLFQTADDLRSYIDNFLQNLEEEPIPVYLDNSNYGAITRFDVATNGILPALYQPASWPTLATNLAELLNGNATPWFDTYSDSVSSGDDTHTFVIMNDNWKSGSAAPLHGIKPLQSYFQSLPEDSKLVSKYQGTEIFQRASWTAPKTHNFNPHYHPEHPKFKTAQPILVLSTTYDPVCPLVSAKKAYDSFEGAGFVEQKSYGHATLSMASLCTAKYVSRYYNEGLLPEAGATCDVDGEYFPGPNKVSRFVDLSFEDAELLMALKELAAEAYMGRRVV